MGKQRTGNRGYQTASEWAQDGGGKKEKNNLPFSRLPFNCCALTFTPFEDPVCTDDGVCFDIVNIVPYLRKHKRHPVSGAPLTLGELTRLHIHKNADGEYHCPVLNKVFTESTHIVAVKTSGNVYCYQAVDELNIKPKHWRCVRARARELTRASRATWRRRAHARRRDLLSDEPFKRR